MKYIVLYLLMTSAALAANNSDNQKEKDKITGSALRSAREFNILLFGAKADGVTLNTKVIQQVIDSLAGSGGGRVVIPEGVFLTGSIVLKSRVELYLEKGAVLLGSINRDDYKMNRWYALILSEKSEDISIKGKGVIDGQGRNLVRDIEEKIRNGKIYSEKWYSRPAEKERPQLIEFMDCKNITVSGIVMKNSSCWVQTYYNCENLIIDSIKVESTAFWNNDGIDISDCRNVKVTNCFVNSADDGICLKSHEKNLCCDNIYIEDCTVRSSASAIKFGTASLGGFRNIYIKRIKVYDTYRSAVALETVDGGILENVYISDISAKNTGNAIFIKLGKRSKEYSPGILRNVHISNLSAEVPNAVPDTGYDIAGPAVMEPHNLFPSSITGLPGYPVSDVTLENIEIIFGGGGKRSVASVSLDSLNSIPELENSYPEFSMFGELPAWGFYIRHANGLKMDNIKLTLKEEDYRPAIVCDDLRDFLIKDSGFRIVGNSTPLILKDVNGAQINNIIVPGMTGDIIKQKGNCNGIK